jgi:ClpP class serine protease
MVRNLAHIANLAFNRPVALEPGYARVFYSVLAGEMGIGRLIDGATGEVFNAEDMAQSAATYRDNKTASVSDDRSRYYKLVDGVAIVPVSGTLAHKYGSIQPYSGMTGYDGIVARVNFAMNDPDVRGVMLDFDSPGGQVAGCFDAVDIIARCSKEKPIWSLGYDMHCSAAQALSSACSRRLITQTGVAGSVGVVMAHTNIEQLLKKNGTEITLFYSGAHKVDGNPYEALPDSVKTRFKAEIVRTRQVFAQKVANNIGMSLQAVLDTEAATYTGQDAVDVGFADEVVNGADAVGLMIEHLNAQGKTLVNMGATMTIETKDKQQAAAPAATTEQATDLVNQPAAVDATAVANTERGRVMGILGCDEAKGREAMASKLANMPTMSIDDAKGILAAAPLVSSNVAGEALAALHEGHGQSLETGAENINGSDEDKQVSALLSSVGITRK